MGVTASSNSQELSPIKCSDREHEEGTEPMEPCLSKPLPHGAKPMNAPGIASAQAFLASQCPWGSQAVDKAHHPGLEYLLQQCSSCYLGKSC